MRICAKCLLLLIGAELLQRPFWDVSRDGSRVLFRE